MANMFGVVADTDGKLYRCNPANSEYDIEILPVPEITMDTELAAALAGKANVFTGLTGTRTIAGHILTFTNGILTGYQAP